MGRQMTVHKPSAAQVRTLQKWLDDSLEGPQKRRIQEILLHGQGLPATEMAQQLGVHVNTVYADLHAFGQEGLATVRTRRHRGRPATISREQVCRICQLADQSPAEVGLVCSRWTLSTLRKYLIRQRIVKHISREHLRRLLKKGACGFATSSANW